ASRMQRAAEEALQAAIGDPELRRILTPDYPIGGKRILISDDYYPALNRKNVELVTDVIDRFSETGLVTRGGRTIDADVIIYATGFESTQFLAPIAIRGVGGRLLSEDWKEGARAFLGISVAGYPNLFMMYGPNTNLGHNSIIFMIECQTNYIVQAVRTLAARDLAWLDLERDVMEGYNQRIQDELSRTVWAATPKSWYKTDSGRMTN